MSIIAYYGLRITSDYRIVAHMNTEAIAVLDHLGGTSAVAKLIEAPVSTVHSWRTIGIPHSRMAHLRLAAQASGKPLPADLSKLTHPKAPTPAVSDAA